MARQKFLDRDAAAAIAARADAVLLGEQHDNPEHHRLQAWVLERMVDVGRRPAVVFEQLDAEDQELVTHLAAEGVSADQLAQAVEWSTSGWPDFAMYRPLFELALRKRLPIRAANLSRTWLRDNASRAEVTVPLPQRLREAMTREIADSHCGYSNEHMTEAMIRMQRLRDEKMARTLAEAASPASPAGDTGPPPPGAVLIAGLGHVRRDRGVPLYLRDIAPRLRTVSLAFLEVSPELEQPQAYVEELGDGEPLPFDYLWFTPRIEREDPCVEFRKQLEQMRKRGGG